MRILLAFFVLAIGFSARAEVTSGNIFVSPTILYWSEIQQRNSKSDTYKLTSDLRIGVRAMENIFLGGIYGIDDSRVKTTGYSSPSQNYDEKTTRRSYGPLAGYVAEDFYVLAAYHFASEWKIESVPSAAPSSTSTYTGRGYQLDAGLKIPLWGFWISPQLSYKYFSYAKLVSSTSGESTLSPELSVEKIDPSLGLWFFF